MNSLAKRWKHMIDFTQHVYAYKKDEISIEDMCKRIYKQLKTNHLYSYDVEFIDLIDQLKMVTDPEMDVDDYDYWLRGLYDWADYDHMAWVEPAL